jgi:hypothetical protein
MAAVLCLLAGCIFSPDKGDPGSTPPPAPVYFTPSTPDTVLLNFVTAYQSRDSVFYKSIYDSSYTGTSTDNAGQFPVVSNFSYDSEIQILANMAKDTQISSIIMNLGTKTRYPSDDVGHPEYALIQLRNVQITINRSNTYYVQQDAGDIFQFRFKPTTPASSSSTDTLWNIVSWAEVDAP